MRRRTLGTAAMLLLLGVFGLCAAGEPEKDYWLTAKDGPYLIYVSSFRGDDAYQMAHDLANELREPPYKLTAFVFKRIDEDAAELRKQMAEMQKEKLGVQEGDKTARRVRVLEEFAVVVGNYRDMSAARSDLDRIKKQPKPKSVKDYGLMMWMNPGEKAGQGKDVRKFRPGDDEKLETRINPFNHAFVIRNPMLPKQERPSGTQPDNRKDTADEDPYEAMNANGPFSLYKCPGKFTLVVKQFAVLPETESAKPSVFDKMRGANPFAGGSSKQPRGGELAASQAIQMAQLLYGDGKGYEVYVLHTPYASLVTVGSFASDKDPAMQKAQKELGGLAVAGTRLIAPPIVYPVPKANRFANSSASAQH